MQCEKWAKHTTTNINGMGMEYIMKPSKTRSGESVITG